MTRQNSGILITRQNTSLLRKRCAPPHPPSVQVTSLGRVVPAAKGKGARSSKGGPYCHLACALWVPEVELSDVPGMSGVRLDKLTAVRVRLRCELCKQAGGAAV